MYKLDSASQATYDLLYSLPDYTFRYERDEYPDEWNESVFRAALEYLCDEGYAQQIKTKSGAVAAVKLTHQGIHKRELEILEYKHLFITRFIPGLVSGIAIGVLSNVLVKWLSGILF